MATHRCEVDGATLRASGDFGVDADTDFDAACGALLRADAPVLGMDLTGVDNLSSTYVGIIAETLLGAKKAGRTVRLRCRTPLAGVLRQAGLGDLAEIVSEEKSPGEGT